MDFPQLQYFNTVANLENMSKAAEILHVSQSALSKNISKLEEEIGYQLFERKGKKLILNAAGAKFLEYSINAISTLDEGVKVVSTEALGTKDILKIGIIGDSYKLVKCASEFIKSNPNISLDIETLLEDANQPSINTMI